MSHGCEETVAELPANELNTIHCAVSALIPDADLTQGTGISINRKLTVARRRNSGRPLARAPERSPKKDRCGGSRLHSSDTPGLYAAPKNTNVQLLWYRTDLVDEPPRTWDEMFRMAQGLKDAGRTHQILTMGGQYEGLVVLFNTLIESAGGSILSADAERVALGEDGLQALRLLRTLGTSGLVSPSFPNSVEDPVRLEFQSGGGAFQLNWPYVYPAMQEAAPELARVVRWARYPRVEEDVPSQVTIGGLNLAVSAYSRHPEMAFEAALCIRSPEHQLFSAINDGVPPTIEAVYDEPEMAEAYPMKEVILAELKDAAVRPRTPAYQNVSTVISATLSPPAAIDPQKAATLLRERIQDALESRGVLP